MQTYSNICPLSGILSKVFNTFGRILFNSISGGDNSLKKSLLFEQFAVTQLTVAKFYKRIVHRMRLIGMYRTVTTQLLSLQLLGLHSNFNNAVIYYE